MAFVRTLEALAAFDSDRPRRDRLLDLAKTKEELSHWRQEEADALDDVRSAFGEDTGWKWEQVEFLSLADIRKRSGARR